MVDAAERTTSPPRQSPVDETPAASGHNFSTPAPQRQRSFRRSYNLSDAPNGNLSRRSSVISNLSFEDGRQSVRSPTEDFFMPKSFGSRPEANTEPSHWDSAPLAFALFPAIGGLLFKNGSAVVTDVTLLGLAAIFLNWSVRLPWDWYHSAQSVRIQEERYHTDTIFEETSEDEQQHEDGATPAPESPSDHASSSDHASGSQRLYAERDKAIHELRVHEMLALVACFLSPLLGAYLLHTIRGQLSRPSEGLVSNYNLTIFVLAAELRPVAHLVKLVQSRTLHLQRIVTPGAFAEENNDLVKVTDLEKRIGEIEVHVANAAEKNTADNGGKGNTAQVTTDVRRNLQPELDALNRAVRRYEKRHMLQTMHTDARIVDLESRLNDALSLAAAAVQTGQRQKSQLLVILTEMLWTTLLFPFEFLWLMLSFPVKMTGKVLDMGKSGLVGSQRRPPRRVPSKHSHAYVHHSHNSHGRVGDRVQGRSMKRI
ncbi:hypothetical protein L228DRAFT_251251 [Xylona heveae TC161]|uniref:Uncharacterized protein n=1 Tax=Xylona heveae (strain CBS 132557 / TC161) TaxID=1328760 RepID=A0A164ZIZ8_XYLHT|nr:hypothetical protein L228DRAFT_251251 [Xylona heveae TC161]KZF19156.1 hypothetical protein L228DRAFT_251251 [Xylona heveae TC161]